MARMGLCANACHVRDVQSAKLLRFICVNHRTCGIYWESVFQHCVGKALPVIRRNLSGLSVERNTL